MLKQTIFGLKDVWDKGFLCVWREYKYGDIQWICDLMFWTIVCWIIIVTNKGSVWHQYLTYDQINFVTISGRRPIVTIKIVNRQWYNTILSLKCLCYFHIGCNPHLNKYCFVSMVNYVYEKGMSINCYENNTSPMQCFFSPWYICDKIKICSDNNFTLIRELIWHQILLKIW